MRYQVLLLFFGLLSNCLGYQIFERDCMGTKFVITIDEDDRERAQKGALAAFAEADRLNLILSDYEDSSELSRFSKSSRTGVRFKLSEDLFRVLNHGQTLFHDTNGSFDVTLGPLSRLWRVARFRKTMPPAGKLSAALSRVGSHHLRLFPEESTGRLGIPDMVLDLGGIAKGYAADRMLEVLREAGMERCLLDCGGDLVIGDPPRNSKGWRISIGGRKHPDLPVLLLSNQAVATSGDLEQSVRIEGKRYSHLIDPSSGLGLTTLSQVTVIASTGMEADSLASACLVMGLQKSRSFLAPSETRAYYLQEKNGKTRLTLVHSGKRK